MIKAIKKIILKQKLNKLGYKWINITPLALKDYKEQVRNNWHEDNWTLERKLNRNWQLSEVSFEDEQVIHRKFGMLTIIYNKHLGMINGITNHRGKFFDCEIDKSSKEKFNKIYGLS